MKSTLAILLLALLPACAAEPDEPEPDISTAAPPVEQPLKETAGFRIPVDFRPECAYLRELPSAPADLTVRDYFGCLTDESRAALARAYQKKAAHLGIAGAPADLDELITVHGDAAIGEASLRDLAFGADYRVAARRDVRTVGIAPPPSLIDERSAGNFGLDPTTCTGSCLSIPVSVVSATRHVGYSPAVTGPTLPPGSGRLLDQILPGPFPDHNQNDLANSELVASGCGPVSEVNLLEWWNIPVFDNGVELTTFDARTDFIADQMDTLDGIDFTNDDDLFDFVSGYPAQLYKYGHIKGYPGSHYMKGDSSAWKVMFSYIARGYPVIALYATGDTSLHWAMITGYQNGKVLIANAGDRTLADFYAQWDSWDSLSWYAAAAAELYVDEDTFIAYTGWGATSTPPPDRFAGRLGAITSPAYANGSSTYRFRYCTAPGAGDDLADAESSDVSVWGGEPIDDPFGYCMFEAPLATIRLKPTPSGNAASSKSGAKLTLSVAATASLNDFVAANPGVRCQFWGSGKSGWKLLADPRCSDASALKYTYTNSGQYSKIAFQVHAADVAQTTWTVKATK